MLLRDPWNERSPVSQRSGRVCEGSWPRTWWGVTAGGNTATTLGELASWRTIANREPAGSRKIQEIPWNINLHFINFRSFQNVPSKRELDSAGCSMPQGMCTPQNMCVIFIRVSGMGLFVWTIVSPWIYLLLITYNHYSASLLPFPGYHRWLSQSERQAPSKQHTSVSQSGGPPQLSGVSTPRTKSGNSKELAFLSLSNDLLQSYSFEFRSGPPQTPIIHTKLQLNGQHH